MSKEIWTPHTGVQPKQMKRRTIPEPQVPEDVKQWGALVGWLRAKYTPVQVRQIVDKWEQMELPLEEVEGTAAPKELKYEEQVEKGDS